MHGVKQISIILLASAAMLLPAFFNGFPLVYSDTGAYIASGFEGSVPGDRPIFYGLFLRHASLAHSLWFVVAAQAILLSALLFYIFNTLLGPTKYGYRQFFISILILSLCSSLPWFSSMLMADVFTAISFLILYILLFVTPSNRWVCGFLVLLYLLAAGTHLTHFPAHFAFLVGLAVLKLFKLQLLQGISWLKWTLISVLVAANLLVIPAVHFAHNGAWVMSKNGHLFLTARFIESGAVKAYLDNECDVKPNFLCVYKDSLPNNGSDFLWLPESVLYKTGGWDSHAQEYKEMNKAIYTSASYFQVYLVHFLKVLSFHVSAHHIGEELIPFQLNSPPGWETEAHFKNELQSFLSAKQAQNYWPGKLNGLNQFLLVVLSLAVLLCLYVLYKPSTDNHIKLFVLSLCLCYAANFIVVCIASSGSRYNARMDWLFVFIAILSLIPKQNSKLKT